METRNYRDTLLRGIALLGLILVLVLGAWGIIVLAFNAPNILGSAGATIAGLFGRDEVPAEEPTVVVPVVSPTTPTAPAAPTTPATPAKPATPAPTYTYTPAAQPVAQLYGYPDLAVRIISIVPQGNRYSMVFEVANYGTNLASGWSFNAVLPLEPTYTYHSGPQQVLRPGDKIVYTLGFDMPRYNYRDYCDRWDDRDDEWKTHDCDKWYDRSSRTSGTVTVTVDPYGHIYELNRGNNTASQRINFNYNYYPQYPWSY